MMRARFTDSIASTEGWSYDHGTEVLVAGDRHTVDTVPESVGRVWLTTGLLEPIAASTEVATAPVPTLTQSPTVPPRRQRAASRR
jgi:hypothetical protein